MKLYLPEDVIGFGKNKGCTLAEIYKYQPSYIEWLIKNISNFSINIMNFKELPIPTPIEYPRSFNYNFGVKEIKSRIEKGVCTIDFDSFNFPLKIIEINDSKFVSYDRKSSLNNYTTDEDDEQTDWSDYNDDLDMDQQGIEFWNQF